MCISAMRIISLTVTPSHLNEYRIYVKSSSDNSTIIGC
ncbi:hypothetical protein SAMN04489725_10354 [Alicyclobacillus hesperidum]|uniref:Uncharacterized protein n=1 Tax=Alicyclobacillus hesperidum TaxID=89784 RepID=A0A1H2RLN5_9BACL|nr:hypothetical protein SAMN04489725_10354 [Alicyclobacillus hesperidum]